MFTSGRAPSATPEQRSYAMASFKEAMARFGVLDADKADARRNKCNNKTPGGKRRGVYEWHL